MNVNNKYLTKLFLLCPVFLMSANATAVAKASQNPISSLISEPFENNANFQ